MKLQQKIIKHHLANRQFDPAFHQISKLNLTKEQIEGLLELAEYRRRIREIDDSEKRTSLEDILAESLNTFIDNLQQKKSFDFTAPLFALIVMMGLEILGFIFCELNAHMSKMPLQNIIGVSGYYLAWFILFICTTALLIYAFLTRDKYQNYFITNSEIDQIKSSLTERYTSFFQQNTSTLLPLNLDIQIPANNEKATVQVPSFNWVELLEKHGNLAFVGEMGLGKTTQVNKLALDWLDDKNQFAIPFIFDLRSFDFYNTSFLTWILTYLDDVYGLPTQMAEELINTYQFLPIFDGLDEIDERNHSHAEVHATYSNCIESIQDFTKEVNIVYYVVCIKEEHFSQNFTKLFNAKIYFKETNQIKQHITNPAFEDVISNPFYFNLAESFSEKEGAIIPNNINDVKYFLLDNYINSQLQKHSTHPKLKQFLAWTASVTTQESTTQFDLTTFQKYHLKHKKLVNLLGGLIYFVFAILICLVFILNIFDYQNLKIDGKNFFLFLGCLASGLAGYAGFSIFNLFQSTQPKQMEDDSFLQDDWFINPYKIKKPRLGYYIKSLKWVENIATGIAIGLATSIVLFIFNYLFDDQPEYPTLFYSTILIISIVVFLVNGCVSSPAFTDSKNPYFNLAWDFPIKLCLLFFAFFFVFEIIDLYYLSLSNITNASIILILAGLLGSSLFYHLILRLIAKLEKGFPLSWIKLFKQATDANILIEQKGQWRFRHQIIEDYFLKEWRKNNGE